MEVASPSDQGKRAIGAARRHIQRPWVSVVLLIAMVVWVQALPYNAPITRIASRSRTTQHYWTMTYYLRNKAPDGTTTFEEIDEDAVSWDRISLLQSTRPDDLMAFNMKGPLNQGFAATTTFDLHFRTVWFGRAYSEADANAVLDVYIGKLEHSGDKETARRIRTGTTRWSNPAGYVNNVLGVVLLGSFVWSLGWVRNMGQWGRNRRIRRGLCASCSYDLSASVPQSDGTRKCPECGEVNPAQKAT